jgi:hypothetical protein
LIANSTGVISPPSVCLDGKMKSIAIRRDSRL